MKINFKAKLSKSTLQLLTAVGLAFLAGLSIFVYTSGVESRVKSDQLTAPVLIALKQIPIGTALGSAFNDGLIETRQFPQKSIPALSISGINASNSDLLALQTLQPGQILLTTNFGENAANTGVLIIPDGQLAVTLSMTDPSRVAGFLQPGSEIAIFATGQKGSSQFTQVLLSKTQVLAIGSQVLPTTDGSQAGNSSALVTVAVSPIQAKRLIHASQTLSLYFGLRTAGVDFGNSGPVTDDTLFGN